MILLPSLQICPLFGETVDEAFLDKLSNAHEEDPLTSLFEDTVVIPQHRDMERCFVHEVLKGLGPNSAFPDKPFTFRDYYKNEYGKVGY
jgi:hypothetical protein